ncbi:MAG TPA: hypothetical protein VFF73_19075 [Planctomycetota bacterium]|nr:hypothetical protein [Planctomycetota bacterium]
MARVLFRFPEKLEGSDGVVYTARACAAPFGHIWEGWIEFVPLTRGRVLTSPRETTQPNFQDVLYWATGLSRVYLEGALDRAEHPRPRVGLRTSRGRARRSA